VSGRKGGNARNGTDDGDDFVITDELRRGGGRIVGGALRVGEYRLEILSLEEPAIGVDFVDSELGGVEHRRHHIGDRSGNIEQNAELYILGVGRAG